MTDRQDSSLQATPSAPGGASLDRSDEVLKRALSLIEFSHSYREDDNRYPRDFWHVRATLGGLDTGWRSYGEQEHREQIESEMAEAERRAADDLLQSLDWLLTAIAPATPTDEPSTTGAEAESRSELNTPTPNVEGAVERVRAYAHWLVTDDAPDPYLGLEIDGAASADINAVLAALEEARRERDEAKREMCRLARDLGEMEGKYKAAHWPGIMDGWIDRATLAESALAKLREEVVGVVEPLAKRWNTGAPDGLPSHVAEIAALHTRLKAELAGSGEG